MKIFAKGTQKYATELLFVKSSKLYTDAAKEVELKRPVAIKLAAKPGAIFINDGTSLIAISSIKLDGSQIVVGETTYNVAAE